MAYDVPISSFNPNQVNPIRLPGQQLRLPVKLAANTKYAAGSLLGEITASPGTFGLVITISNVALTSNVVTVTTKGPHGLNVGDTVTVTAVTATTINGSGNVITSVPSATTFTYAKTASNVTSAADTGTVVRDAGTSTPKAVLSAAVSTDANGVPYLNDSTDPIDGSCGVAPYFTGEFDTAKIPNLDAVALAAMTGAKLLAGSLTAGVLKIA